MNSNASWGLIPEKQIHQHCHREEALTKTKPASQNLYDTMNAE